MDDLQLAIIHTSLIWLKPLQNIKIAKAVVVGARDRNLREAAEIVFESLHLRGSHPPQGEPKKSNI